jgi:hypothetical protein
MYVHYVPERDWSPLQSEGVEKFLLLSSHGRHAVFTANVPLCRLWRGEGEHLGRS